MPLGKLRALAMHHLTESKENLFGLVTLLA